MTTKNFDYLFDDKKSVVEQYLDYYKKYKKIYGDHRNFENGDKYSEKILEIGNHVYNIFPILQILTLYPYSQKGINFSYSDDFVEFITNEKIL